MSTPQQEAAKIAQLEHAKPDELEHAAGRERENLEGWIPELATEAEVREALEKAFDYRGDITVTLKNGSKVEGYLFDRRQGATLAQSFIRIIPMDNVGKVNVAYSDIAALAFKGRDTAAGNDVRVETIPVPEIGPGEVLVKIHTCGICGTDLKKIHTGSHDAPRVFGHEMAGRRCKVGEGVTDFSVDDRVMAYHHIPCGECYYCRKQTFAQCEVYKKQ